MFVGREDELDQLTRLYESNKAEFFVLYGRRRIGKTELLRHFVMGKPNLFFVATLSSEHEQLANFSQQIWRFTHPNSSEGVSYPNWESAFRALADLPGRPVVILDEFTYLISGNKAIPSILQKVWDEVIKDSQIFLILCGSYVGMIETEVLAYGSPLYGRRSASRLLTPLQLPTITDFFSAYTLDQQIEMASVAGGMPYYLQIFSDKQDIFSNIRQHILETRGTLFEEPRLLMMEELREPRNYFSILSAIAGGRTRLNEISQMAGVGSAAATASYLDILQQMRLINRRVPVTETQPQKSKKGIYHITDPFLRFWFRYVHPNRSSLDLGLAEGILEQRIKPTFDIYVGFAFEEMAREYLARLARSGKLTFLPDRIGSWWDRDHEIDVVAVNDREKYLLVGECKWSIHPVGMNVLDELKEKTKRLAKYEQWGEISYALFSRSGFTAELLGASKLEDILLITASDLLKKEL